VTVIVILNGAYGDGGDDDRRIRYDFHGALPPVMNKIARALTALPDSHFVVGKGTGAPVEAADFAMVVDIAVAVAAAAEDIAASLVVGRNAAGVDEVYTRVVDQLGVARSGRVVKKLLEAADKGSSVSVEGM